MDNKLNIPKIRVNAEFQRLMWLNMSWGMITGIIILYSLFIFAKANSEDLVEYIAGVGTFGAFISSIALYLQIERSLRQDVSSNAFDQLRMSSLSPWQMAWARIVVAPLTGWVIFLIGWILLGLTMSHFNHEDNDVFIMWLTMPLYSWALACMILVNALQFKRGNDQWEGSLLQILLLFVVMVMFLTGMLSAAEDLSYLGGGVSNTASPIIASIISVVLCSVAARAAMAERLHLRSSRLTFIVLGLLTPLAAISFVSNYQQALYICAVAYGGMSILSLITQKQTTFSSIGEFVRTRNRKPKWAIASLPAWMILLPLGLICAVLLSADMVWVYIGQFFLLILLVFSINQMKWRYNNITITLLIYLLLRGLWFVIAS
ncbi:MULTISPECIES: hypothetical protein [Neisseria]|uniref:Beta-carotene 15,15'-monooxygenase n=1 Tax=Neisseria macacae ATCC 33926 TaxID=997348 RepID=A0AA36UGR7_9NEIS|nr:MULTISPECIES: hypothetical protein [Neisseria]EGQ74966.1 brp/Blh family beta-carotene 15,15'-monooxygenase [Neisseria macacae ATCC 33926]UNV85101.1 beta-carotene 15,15'-monooxygenase [Neisseria macacae ATCC 33926]